MAVYHPQSSEAQRELEMARDDRVYFHLYPVLVHLARTVGLPIEIVKYIRDEVRASGIRARQALKGHLQAGGIVNWLLTKRMDQSLILDTMRVESLQRARARQLKSLRLNWTPREKRYWVRLDNQTEQHEYHRVFGWFVFYGPWET